MLIRYNIKIICETQLFGTNVTTQYGNYFINTGLIYCEIETLYKLVPIERDLTLNCDGDWV